MRMPDAAAFNQKAFNYSVSSVGGPEALGLGMGRGRGRGLVGRANVLQASKGNEYD